MGIRKCKQLIYLVCNFENLLIISKKYFYLHNNPLFMLLNLPTLCYTLLTGIVLNNSNVLKLLEVILKITQGSKVKLF